MSGVLEDCSGWVPAGAVKRARGCLRVNQRPVLLLAVTNGLWCLVSGHSS